MEKKRRVSRHRLSMDIMDTIYKRILEEAHKRNITVTLWVTRAIIRELAKEDRYR